MKYIIGDIHTRKEEPFFGAAESLFNHLKDKILKKGDEIYQVGDLFHYSKPSPKEYELVISFLLWCEANNIKVSLMTGNHDFNVVQNTFSIDPLKEFCDIYNFPFMIKEFERFDFVFLPWISTNTIKDMTKKNLSLKEFYSEWLPSQPDIVKKLSENKKTFLFYHFPDETISFGGEFDGISLKKYEELNPNIVRIGGDIHTQKENYIGTPYQTRYDEKGQTGRLYYIHDDGLLGQMDLPNFLEYKDIKFGETSDYIENNRDQIILTISEAPSVSLAKESYEGYHIRKIDTLTNLERDVSTKVDSNSDIKKLLSDFLTINSVDKKTSKYLQEMLQ